MTNPLLDFSDLPRFDQIRPEHVAPAMDDLLARAESALEAVTAPDFPAQWTAIATVLDVATDPLDPLIGYAVMAGFDQNTPSTPGHVFQVKCTASCASLAAPSAGPTSPPVR